MKDLSFAVISDVIDSWEALRRVPNFEAVAGKELFRGLFAECPEVMNLFGFKNVDKEETFKSKRFQMHAVYLIEMFDSAFNMLGPDRELLTEVMNSLGKKHVRYGVQKDMFPAMGKALLHTLETLLGKDNFVFNDRVRDSWNEVYGELVHEMIEGMDEAV